MGLDYSSVDFQINKIWYVIEMEYHSHIKKNIILSSASKQMELERTWNKSHVLACSFSYVEAKVCVCVCVSVHACMHTYMCVSHTQFALQRSGEIVEGCGSWEMKGGGS